MDDRVRDGWKLYALCDILLVKCVCVCVCVCFGPEGGAWKVYVCMHVCKYVYPQASFTKLVLFVLVCMYVCVYVCILRSLHVR